MFVVLTLHNIYPCQYPHLNFMLQTSYVVRKSYLNKIRKESKLRNAQVLNNKGNEGKPNTKIHENISKTSTSFKIHV